MLLLYGRKYIELIINLYTVYICFLAAFSLQYVFDNYKFNRSVTVTGVSYGLTGFGMSSSSPIRYFIINQYECKIYVFDEFWNFLSENSSITNAAQMIQVENYFYITSDDNVLKTDENLNVLITYTVSEYFDPEYFGLYYNSIKSVVYVAAKNLYEIHVFSLNLELTDTILIAPFSPWSINGYNNQLYVGTMFGGTILVLVNKQITKQFDACNGQSGTIRSILFDQFDNMATTCGNNQLYLYNTNGFYLNKSIQTVDDNFNPLYIGFDSKLRLVVVLYTQISLYN